MYLMVPMITLFIFSPLDRNLSKAVIYLSFVCVCMCVEKIHIILARRSSRSLIGERLLHLSEARWNWGDNSPWKLGKENCHFWLLPNKQIIQDSKKSRICINIVILPTNVYSLSGNFFTLFSQLKIITKICDVVVSLRFCFSSSFMECYSCRNKNLYF